MNEERPFHAAQARKLSELIEDISFRAQLLTFRSQMLASAAVPDPQWLQLLTDTRQLTSLALKAADIARELTPN